MQHLDEGTVHAWLDGALSEIESDAAGRHVGECAQCAALVAEARGVMAGAARIVAALDVGPVGVIPKSPRAVAPKAGFWRRFASSPSRMAMAATILVAVGVTLTVRRVADDNQAAPGPVNGRAVVSSPIAPASPATSPSSAPAQTPPSTAESKDLGTSPARSKQTSAVAPTASVRDEAGFASRSIKQSASANVAASAVADNALADKKKDADPRRDRPEVPKTLAETRPQFQGAPAPVRADSAGAGRLLAKAADSIAAQPPPPTVRRLEAASRSPMREAAAQSQKSRAATLDAMSEASLRGCYRLSVDSSAWRGVLPTSFELAGSPGRSQIASSGGGQGAVPQDAARRATDAGLAFSGRSAPVSYGVHVIGATGKPDSTAIGDWTIVEPMTARVRFATVDRGRLVTVLISTASPVARVMAGERTDSLRITPIVCPR